MHTLTRPHVRAKRADKREKKLEAIADGPATAVTDSLNIHIGGHRVPGSGHSVNSVNKQITCYLKNARTKESCASHHHCVCRHFKWRNESVMKLMAQGRAHVGYLSDEELKGTWNILDAHRLRLHFTFYYALAFHLFFASSSSVHLFEASASKNVDYLLDETKK